MRRNLLDRVGRIISGATNSLISSIEDEMPESILTETLADIYKADEELALEIGELEALNSIDIRKSRQLDEQYNKLGDNMTLESATESLQRAGIRRQIEIEKAQSLINNTIANRNNEIQALTTKRGEVEGVKAQIEEKLNQVRSMANVQNEIQNGVMSRGGRVARTDRILNEAKATGHRFVPTASTTLEDSEEVDKLLQLDTDREVEARLALLRGGDETEASA